MTTMEMLAQLAKPMKVDPTKENALEACNRLLLLVATYTRDMTHVQCSDFVFLKGFIDAAARKLPRQRTLDKSRKGSDV